jgi:hypothetical protein
MAAIDHVIALACSAFLARGKRTSNPARWDSNRIDELRLIHSH